MKSIALVLGAFVLILGGCAASGTQVTDEQLSKFEPGKTTVSDVVASLGAPQQQVRAADGSRMLIYSYAQVQTRPETFIPFVGAFVGGADTKSNAAILSFDRAGVLKKTSSSEGATGSGYGLSSGTGVPERVPDQPKQAE